MAPNPALRNQWTIKSKRIDQELLNGCKMAADRQGMAMGDWCVEILREGVRKTLTNSGDDSPKASPPARLEDVAATILSAFEQHRVAVDQRIGELSERLVHQPVHQAPAEVHQPGVPADNREARRLRVAMRRGRVGGRR
jgi:hypothetical protein